MSQYQITISRAHKVAERLGQRAQEAKEKASKLSEPITLQGYSDSQLQRFHAQSQELLDLVSQAHRLSSLQANVRAAIGQANANHGVSDALAAIEGNKKTLTLVRAILDNQNGESYSATSVTIDDLLQFKSLGQADRAPSVSLRILSPAQKSKLETMATDLERENFVLNDKLADFNGKTLTIEVDDETAHLIGLKP